MLVCYQIYRKPFVYTDFFYNFFNYKLNWHGGCIGSTKQNNNIYYYGNYHRKIS